MRHITTSIKSETKKDWWQLLLVAGIKKKTDGLGTLSLLS